MLGLLVACAPGATVNADAAAVERDMVWVQVAHTVPATPSVTVHLIDPVGPRRLLGVVGPGQTETFGIVEPAAGEYRLVAPTPDGRTQTFRPFHLVQREVIRWDLTSNAVTALPAPEPEPQ